MDKKVYVSPAAEITLFAPAEHIASQTGPKLFWGFENIVTESIAATTIDTNSWDKESSDSYKGNGTYKYP